MRETNLAAFCGPTSSGVVDIILRNGRKPIRTEAYKTFNHADEAILSSERGKSGSTAHPAGAGEGM